MKKNTHPKYQKVLFVDTSTGSKFLCGSTLEPEEKEMYEGKSYPVYKLPISAASHPLFTGSKGLVDAEGRVDKFRKRYASKPAPQPENVKPTLIKKGVADKKGPAEKKSVAKKAKAPTDK